MPNPGPGAAPSPGPLDEHARRAARAYGAAADHYNLPTLSFWDRLGAATVARLPLAPGQRVLDLCCGAGAAQPAAVAVPGQHHLDHPDRFWDIVLGTGYRGTVEVLSPEQRDSVLVVQGTDVNRYPKPAVYARHEDSVNSGPHILHTGGRFGSCLVIPVLPGTG